MVSQPCMDNIRQMVIVLVNGSTSINMANNSIIDADKGNQIV